MATQTEQPYPSRAYAWYVVVLLTIAYAISLLDRWILSLLVGPVKAHFGVSDTQMGLLMGFWFAIFYVTMGLPFGWIADRFDRRRVVALAMAFWCSMTVACGLAKSFGQLAAARLGIGLGEAALTPAANSLIADHFPRAEQNRAITFLQHGHLDRHGCGLPDRRCDRGVDDDTSADGACRCSANSKPGKWCSSLPVRPGCWWHCCCTPPCANRCDANDSGQPKNA